MGAVGQTSSSLPPPERQHCMWVQLTSIQYVTEHGKQVTKYPGDFVNVGKQHALLWLQRGDAVMPSTTDYSDFEIMEGSGVLIIDNFIETKQEQHPLRKTFEPFPELEVKVGASCIVFRRNVLWHPGIKTRPAFIPTGLMLLNTWQMAVPIWDYEQLATHTGSETDKQRTHEVIGDLRVPLYDTRLIFCRNDAEVQRLFDRWDEEKELGDGDEKHAFLRALYRTPLLILALPITWTRQDVR